MTHSGEQDPFDFFTDTPRGVCPANTTTPVAADGGGNVGGGPAHNGKPKVLMHNPFATMGPATRGKDTDSSKNDGGGSVRTRSEAATPREQYVPVTHSSPQRPFVTPTTVNTTHTNVSLDPSVSQTSWQEKAWHHKQPQQQTILSSNAPRVAERAGSASSSAFGEAASGDTNVTTAYSRPPFAALRGPSSTTDMNASPNVAGTKKFSSFAHLLRKDPPDFLKLPLSARARRQESSGAVRSQSPYNSFAPTTHAHNGSRMTSHLRSGSADTNSERQLQQNLQEPFSVSATLGSNEEKHAASFISSVPLTPVEQKSNNGPKPPFPFSSSGHTVMSQSLSTLAPTRHQPTLKSTGGSGAPLPPEFVGEGESKTIFHGSVANERQVAVEGEMSLPRPGATMLALLETGSSASSTMLSGRVTHETANHADGIFVAPSAASSRRNTAGPGRPLHISSLSNSAHDMAGSVLPPPPPPPPPSQPQSHPQPLFPSRPLLQDDGGAPTSFSPEVSSWSMRLGLDTPRNGEMGLQKHCNKHFAPLTAKATECSPAPFVPSREGSEENFFNADVSALTVDRRSSMYHPKLDDDKEVKHRVEVHQKNSNFFTEPIAATKPHVSGGRPVTVPSEEEEAAGHTSQLSVRGSAELSAQSHGSRLPLPPPRQSMTEMMALKQSNPLDGKNDVFSSTKDSVQTSRPPNKRVTRAPCFAHFTSTGRVVMVSNLSHRQGTSAVLRSWRLADVLSGDLEETKSTKSGEEHVKALRVLVSSSSSFVSSDDSSVSLTRLQDIVRQMPGLSFLLQEVLIFLLRDPQPDWRSEGHNALIKILSTAVEEMKTSSEHHLHYPLNAKPPQVSAEGLRKVQQLLCAGKREAAVETALEHHLYSHAIIIAMVCPKKETYMGVIRAVIQHELDSSSPLAHAYCMFNEIPLPPFLPPEPAALSTSLESQDGVRSLLQGSWVQQAAILLSNFTKGSAEGLIELGDTLLKEGMVDEAHCCFLLAHLSPMGTPPLGRPLQPKQQHVMDLLRERLGMLCGRYHPQGSRAAFVSPKSTLLTEVLQAVRCRLETYSLASSGGIDTHSSRHGIPVCPERYRAAFRYMQVLWLHEVGLSEEALQLMADLRRIVPPESTEVSPFTLNRIISRGVIPSLPASGDRKQVMLTEGQASCKPVMNQRIPSSLPPKQNFPPASSLTSGAATTAPPPGTPHDHQATPTSQPRPKQTNQVPPLPPLPPLPPPPPSRQQQNPVASQHLVGDPMADLPHSRESSASVSQGLSGMRSATNATSFSAHSTPVPSLSSAPQPQTASGGSSNSAAAVTDVDKKPEVSSASSSQPSRLTRGRAAETQQTQREPVRRSRSLEVFTNFFFGRKSAQETKKDEVKRMIIDTAEPPKFDPATKRYLFDETEEEKKAAEMVRAGPPKPSSWPAKNPTAKNAPPPMPHRQVSSGSVPRPQYVDMFNNS